MTNTHLVLVEEIRDVVGHVVGRVGQNKEHVGVGRGRRSQPVGLSLHQRGQLMPAQLILCLAQTWGHLT